MEPTPRAEEKVVIERIEEFVTGYANNVQFEPTAWDLKMLFGELSQTGGRVTVAQHTSITIAWAEAKILSYYLRIQIAAYELQHGKIQVPKEVLPPVPTAVPANVQDKESAEVLRQIVGEMRAEFLANL
jgi:hypothetical protein